MTQTIPGEAFETSLADGITDVSGIASPKSKRM